MRNEEFIKKFFNSNGGNAKNQHIFYEDNVLYDYGYHFPLAIKLNNGYVIVNKYKYSRTTSRHQNIILNNVDNDKLIQYNTYEMRDIINISPKITDIKEIMIKRLEKE